MPGGNQSFTNPVWEQIRDHQNIFNGAFAYSTMRFNLVASGEVRYAAGNLGERRLLPHARSPARARATLLGRRRSARLSVDRRAERRVSGDRRTAETRRPRENDLAQHTRLSDRRRGAGGIRRTRGRPRHAGVRADLRRAGIPRAKHVSSITAAHWWLTLMARTRPSRTGSEFRMLSMRLPARRSRRQSAPTCGQSNSGTTSRARSRGAGRAWRLRPAHRSIAAHSLRSW